MKIRKKVTIASKNNNNRLKEIRPGTTPAARAILDCDRPIIAAVNGAAVGWGMDLSLMADFRIASDKAKFGELFVKRGLVADVGGMLRLPKLVGPEKAAELLFTGDIITAAQAEEIGMLMKVVPHEELLVALEVHASEVDCEPLARATPHRQPPQLRAVGKPRVRAISSHG